MNNLHIIGKITKEPIYDYTSTNRIEFMKTEIAIERPGSSIIDTLPVSIPKSISSLLVENKLVEIKGEFRSRNQLDEAGKSHLILYVYPKEIYEVEEDTDTLNEIELEGTICKAPIFRTTLSGKKILDCLLAVSGNNNKRSNYLPCILWDRTAELNSNFKVGDKVVFKGNVHSRMYTKDNEVKTAYEVSVNLVESDAQFELDDIDEIKPLDGE